MKRQVLFFPQKIFIFRMSSVVAVTSTLRHDRKCYNLLILFIYPGIFKLTKTSLLTQNWIKGKTDIDQNKSLYDVTLDT